MAIDDGPVDTVRLAALELGLQRRLGGGVLRKDDEAGGVLVDAVDDERLPPAERAEVLFDLSAIDGTSRLRSRGTVSRPAGLLTTSRQSSSKTTSMPARRPGRVVRRALPGLSSQTRRASPVESRVPAPSSTSPVRVHLAARDSIGRAAPRAEPLRVGQKLVEACAGVFRSYCPARVGHFGQRSILQG